ncbi:dynein intermediate chain 2, ciliary-like [Agrilus planipennis]|uniref:Dynein intermediate chain 2, ciliary-like n=1 Tax=Agrilus planipennis TaxID=224129 RepID=A0A1W4X7V0_AGRPL|nr:dynein intermediate chain 2, ciliary-like [Agrilus planipennis]
MVSTGSNEYENVRDKLDSIRTVVDSATQTLTILMKPKFTYLTTSKMINCANSTNNWIMYDTYCTKFVNESSQLLDNKISNEIFDSSEVEASRLKFMKLSSDLRMKADKMTCLYENVRFAGAVREMEQIICLNLNAQKCFRGLTKSNKYDLESNINYRLQYLWSFIYIDLKKRRINSVCWNGKNSNLLAVSYEGELNECSRNILIWNMKHHSQPERLYRLNFAISDINWSTKKPNQLVIGCYNGIVKIIDVSNRHLAILCVITQKSVYKYLRIWNVKCWCDDDHEYILTSNEDGKIFCSKTKDDDGMTEKIKVSRTDNNNWKQKKNQINSFESR